MPGLTSGIPADSPSGDAEGDSYSRIGFQPHLIEIAMIQQLALSQRENGCRG